jgi:hypothetical protein
MRTYERPTLHRVGSFSVLTGHWDSGTGDVFVPPLLDDVIN